MEHFTIALMLVLGSMASVLQEAPPHKARVLYVDAKLGFLAIDKGEADGLKVGMEFEIVREKAGGTVTLGKATLEKFFGKGRMGKLVFTEGDASLVRPDDWALYRRKV